RPKGRRYTTSPCRFCSATFPTALRSASSRFLHRRPRIAKLSWVASPYIERILKARVYDVAIESPLDHAPRLSRRLGNTILLKREDLQAVFSFKLRGAYNGIALISESA